MLIQFLIVEIWNKFYLTNFLDIIFLLQAFGS